MVVENLEIQELWVQSSALLMNFSVPFVLGWTVGFDTCWAKHCTCQKLLDVTLGGTRKLVKNGALIDTVLADIVLKYKFPIGYSVNSSVHRS